MKARYYGACPITPGTTIDVYRWYLSGVGFVVLLEFTDKSGVKWVGPEFPRDLASSRSVDVKENERHLRVIDTIIDSTQGWTDITVEESS
jgi:hypothetical protein